NVVAAGLADRCEIQVSYAIGVAEPTSISVNTFGTGKIDDSRLIGLIREHFDLRPYAITKMLDLLHPMYRPTAAYGHFGRNPFEMTYEWDEIEGGKKVKKSESFTAFTWERTDKADALRAAAGLEVTPPSPSWGEGPGERAGTRIQVRSLVRAREIGPLPTRAALTLPPEGEGTVSNEPAYLAALLTTPRASRDIPGIRRTITEG